MTIETETPQPPIRTSRRGLLVYCPTALAGGYLAHQASNALPFEKMFGNAEQTVRLPRGFTRTVGTLTLTLYFGHLAGRLAQLLDLVHQRRQNP